MESSKYVDATLTCSGARRDRSPRTGLCLQAYLHRTAADLDSLLPLAPAIRLVKGAYREPPEIAFPKKADVDENYFRLAARMLQPDAPPGHSARHARRAAHRVASAGIAAQPGTPV